MKPHFSAQILKDLKFVNDPGSTFFNRFESIFEQNWIFLFHFGSIFLQNEFKRGVLCVFEVSSLLEGFIRLESIQ